MERPSFGLGVAMGVLITAVLGLAIAVVILLGDESNSDDSNPSPGSDASTAPQASSHEPVIFCGEAGDAFGDLEAVAQPEACARLGADETASSAINLRRLQWTSWGESRATATGVECGRSVPCAGIRADVEVSRLQVLCGKPTYMNLQLTTKYGTAGIAVDDCSGGATYTRDQLEDRLRQQLIAERVLRENIGGCIFDWLRQNLNTSELEEAVTTQDTPFRWQISIHARLACTPGISEQQAECVAEAVRPKLTQAGPFVTRQEADGVASPQIGRDCGIGA